MKKYLLILLFSTLSFGQSGLIARQNFAHKATGTSFVSTWNTVNTSSGSSTSTQVKLPLVSSGTYSFTVQWGDGNSDTITVWNAAATTHTYSSSGTYTITISGICTGWQFNNTGDRNKIMSISSWGGLRLGNSNSYFYGCTNLTLATVSDVLNLTGTTTLESAFQGCTALTTVNLMNSWNISSVTNLNATFRSCTNFNQNIGSWDTANVTTTFITFGGTKFNQNIGNWNTSNVTNMAYMFQNNGSFNQNIGAWNVTKVTSFANMFQNATTFNNGGSSDINNWILKTSAGSISFDSMFSGATAFNQPIGSWNTANVTTTSAMFQSANNFNQNIGSWNTANVTTTSAMFQSANNFNQNIGAWNVTKVTAFDSMFQNATAFNNGGSSDINNWVLKTSAGAVTFTSMFQSAINFNQPLNLWTVTNMTNASSMFNGATAFNQNIGSWNILNLSTATNFMAGKTSATFSTTNLDAIYNGWSLISVKPSVSISFGTAKYTAASSAGRLILTNAPNNWTITDGGI